MVEKKPRDKMFTVPKKKNFRSSSPTKEAAKCSYCISQPAKPEKENGRSGLMVSSLHFAVLKHVWCLNHFNLESLNLMLIKILSNCLKDWSLFEKLHTLTSKTGKLN